MKIEEYDELTDDALQYIKYVCDMYGPRISGTKEERESLDELEDELKKFSDFTYYDTYKVYPTFYPRDFILIFGISVIISAFTFFFRGFWGLISAILPIIGLFIFYVSLVKMKYWFAFLSKKGISHNATGRILPRNSEGEIIPGKLKIIIAGHQDSAFQMKITRFGDKSAFFFAGAIIYSLSVIVLSILKTIFTQIGLMKYIIFGTIFGLTWIDFIFIGLSLVGFPVFVIALHGFIGGTPVPGANDNLSGVGLALAVGKHFSQDKNRLKNVELWIGSFGSEECGERGSHAFIKKYSEMGLLDKNSIAIIPESLGAGSNLGILTKELMHLVTHDYAVCEYINTAFESLVREVGNENVIQCRIVPDLKMGASDGGRFALAGYSSSTLFGYEGKIKKPPNWHEVTDDPDHLKPKTLRTAIGIYIHLIKNLDEKIASDN